MRRAITNTLMKAIPGILEAAEDPSVDIRDTTLRGFVLRARRTGIHTYRVQYGRGRWYTVGTSDRWTPMQARDEAKRILADVTRGIDPMAAKRAAKAHSLQSFMDDVYGPWANTHLKTGEAIVARIGSCFLGTGQAPKSELADKKLGEITPWLVEKWRSARLKAGKKPATVNRDIGALKSALAKASEWGHLEEQPLKSVKPAKVDSKGVVRFLSTDEESRLRKALRARDQRIRDGRASANQWRKDRGYAPLPDLTGATYADRLEPLVVVALSTGARKGELYDLHWGDVDLERAFLTVQGATAKSGATRHLPLNSEALATLKGWRKQNGGPGPGSLVFPGRDGERLDNNRRSWAGVLAAAGITDFRWHDLRHTFASKLVMAGVDLNTVRELLGHGDIAMTLRYAHLAPEHGAAAVERLVS